MYQSIENKMRILMIALVALAVLFVSGCSVTPKVDPYIAYEPT